MCNKKWRFLSLAVAAFIFLDRPAAADQCEDQPDPESGIAACTKMINSGIWKGHNQAINYFNRGNAYREKGDQDRAIADYTQAVGLDPKYASAFNNRGDAYSKKGDQDRAVADYTRAIGLDPKKTNAYYNRGNAYRTKGDYELAIADYTQAISLDPKDPNAYNNRGFAYANKGDYDLAIANYTQAISLGPKRALVSYNNRGNAYREKGDQDLAIADYTQAIGLVPKDPTAYINRGFAFGNKGDYDRATADYNVAISLDPKSGTAYFNRGRINLYAGSPDKALADLNQASALSPKAAYVALWVDIVSQRDNLPGRLSQTSSQIDMTAWPAPVIRLFMGQMTPGALLVAADDPNGTTKKGQICEANFYTGELSLLKGAKEEATRLFRLAASDCPRGFIEWSAAKAELRALGVSP